jgi:hypothetical protein
MLQPGRFVAQHVADSPFADRLHLVEQNVVGSVLQCQQLSDGAVFGVHGNAQISAPLGLISM